MATGKRKAARSTRPTRAAGAAVPAPRRTAFHHGDLRNALLDAATRAIAARGVEALSVRALAQETGVFHRAAYRHFADKSALVAAVFTAAYQRLASALALHAGAGAPRERLRQAALAYAEFAFREPQLFLALAGPRINEQGAYPELERALTAAAEPVLAAIRDGIAGKSLPAQEPQLAATFYWAALQGVLVQVLQRRIKVRADLRQNLLLQVADRLYAALEHGER